jgi:hypothetical protein
MRRSVGFSAFFATASLLAAALSSPAGAGAAAQLTVRLTGLNRAGHVVAVPQAEFLSLTGASQLYQGAPVTLSPGTYLVAAEVPAYGAAHALTSQTLVVRQLTIRRSETIRLDGRAGKRLTVTLTGVRAQDQILAAGACLASSPHGSGAAEQAAWGGGGVAVYAVPVRSAYVSFTYLSILQSAASAHYYLIGSAGGGIPFRLSYRQRAADLAKMTMVLRGGAFASSSMDWGISSGDGQSFCGGGQNAQVMQPQSWVNYLTPGTWTTTVETYSQGRDGNLNPNAYFFSVRRYRAHTSYTDTFGAAVAGPGPSFPQMAADQFDYGPLLFNAPGVNGGSICCSVNAITLKLGNHVVARQKSACQSCFHVVLHRAGWYTLTATARRFYRGGNTPASLLSPQVSVSFRFHAAPRPPGTGNWQNFPVTDTQYQPFGLNIDNQAAAGGRTIVQVQVERPGNAGTPTPVYRLKTVRLFASVNGGKTWQPLALTRVAGSWRATVHDPQSGYVSLRSVVTDVHGDSTTQTVYRAYAIR